MATRLDKKDVADISSFDVIHLHYPLSAGESSIEAVRLSRSNWLLPITWIWSVAAGKGYFKIYTRLTLPKVVKAADRLLVSSLDYARHGFWRRI